MDNGNELIRAIIDKKIRESLMAQQAQYTNSNFLDRLKGIGNRLDSIGGGLSSAGNYLSNNTSLTGLGAGSQAVGGVLQKGAGTIQNLAAPLAAGAATGATAGATAGGAASGAAMSNPVTALVALGAMALTGANRHRAEKAGQQAEQLANGQMDIAQNQLSQVPQSAITTNDYTPAPIPQATQTQQNPEDIKRSAFSGVASGVDDFLNSC